MMLPDRATSRINHLMNANRKASKMWHAFALSGWQELLQSILRIRKPVTSDEGFVMGKIQSEVPVTLARYPPLFTPRGR